MNRVYGVSDKHTGPWLGEADAPDKALAHGRALWGNRQLYVAEIAPLVPSVGLPNIYALVGDVREQLVDGHGVTGNPLPTDENPI